jgi:glycine hydroxymethyltransferase
MNDLARSLRETDPDVFEAIQNETCRQDDQLELIPSENFVPEAVLEAAGSVFTNKYAEGYPAKRYYGGCEWADRVEQLAISRAKQLFGAEHANVQPHAGSQANMAAYAAVLQPGDTIFGMNLSHGGHLTHGSPVNFSGRYYKVIPYGVSKDTETIDYDEMEKMAVEQRPKMIIAGGSAYSRIIDFARLRQIADRAGSLLLVDMAHFAGLVAAGIHPSPVPYSDIVTSTTHKTLRGPRSGFILSRAQYAQAIDKMVFPGMQGGPLVHIIAAKAVCFHLAMQPEFKQYQARIVANARALAAGLVEQGFRVVSGGTDTHLLLVDVFREGLLGRPAETALHDAGITVNRNTIPFETNSPFNPSGIRLGTPAVTTRGMNQTEMRQIAVWIGQVLRHHTDQALISRVREQVRELCCAFPLYSWKLAGGQEQPAAL